MLLAENFLSGGSMTLALFVLIGVAAFAIFVQLLWYDPKLRDNLAGRVKDRVNGFKHRR